MENTNTISGRLAHSLQPVEFRENPAVPKWVHFPRLHLLLGWGPGLWETLNASMHGLRHVFLTKPEDGSFPRPPIVRLITSYDQYYDFTTMLGAHAPQLVIEAVGDQSVFYRLDNLGLHIVNTCCRHGSPHDIVLEADYRVRHDSSPTTGVTLIIEKRTRKLKLEYQKQMEVLGLTYAPGTGKRDTRPDGMRTPREQHFAEWVSTKKATFVERRVHELLKDEIKRPASFKERASAIMRSREGEIRQGKRNKKGALKKPHKQEELIALACKEIARLEAANLMYDFGSEDFCTFDAQGLTIHSDNSST